MAKVKGPAIPEDTFDMTGHCCGARYTGIKNLTEQGFRFELTEEAKAYLRAQGIEVPAVTGHQEPVADEVSFGHESSISSNSDRLS